MLSILKIEAARALSPTPENACLSGKNDLVDEGKRHGSEGSGCAARKLHSAL